MTKATTTTSDAPSYAFRVGITGGIGSGKSYICRQLEAYGHHVFYCDEVAKHIIRTHPAVKCELQQLVGNEVYDAEGRLVKSVLAAYLCRGKAYSRRVDAIVHPRVAEAFEQFCRDTCPNAQKGTKPILNVDHNKQIAYQQLQALPPSSTVFMECALLFESGFDRLVNTSVLVHVSHATQLARLMARDHISREKALSWMALQLSEEEKMQRAFAILPNE